MLAGGSVGVARYARYLNLSNNGSMKKNASAARLRSSIDQAKLRNGTSRIKLASTSSRKIELVILVIRALLLATIAYAASFIECLRGYIRYSMHDVGHRVRSMCEGTEC